ncbi:ATP-binding cassette domain-containing protein [Aeromicrobium sp. CTD01-1L150]|uniref:ATP-binding cassette domain-containing protein n=1 Tax=Aeromicrobium sp. CTD01-1L150 TaxID=3341830 RepID=UPI0035C0E93B
MSPHELLGSIENLTVEFPRRRSLGDLRPAPFTAVDHATLDLRPGEITGLVGESGSGKSTVARALLRLVPFSGRATVCGFEVGALPMPAPLAYRRAVQAVFQDPIQALNPRHTVAEIVGEPLLIQVDSDAATRRDRVVATLQSVGLDESFLQRTTRELSGGQRQRVAIARAIIVEPSLLLLDEALSALDVTTAASVARLLHGLLRPDSAMLFIGHDLAMVRQLCDRVHVMREGRIVESGTAEQVCGAPQHEYTQLLIESIPRLLGAETV